MLRGLVARLYPYVQKGRTALSRFHEQTTPRGRGMLVILAMVLFLALATGEGVLYRLSYLLALVMAGSYAWIGLSLCRLEMRVHMQSSVAEVGGVLAGSIYVRNDSHVPTGWLEILQISDMPGYVFGEVTQLPAKGWAEWNTQGACHARGVYSLGPLVANSSDPLGLFRMQIEKGEPLTVVVYPSTMELPHFSLPPTDMSGEDKVRHRLQIRSSQASTVREYRQGDSLNRIHWPSSARCGQLMSKDFDSPAGSDVWIVLDLEKRVHETLGFEKTDECAVAIAASLARLALTHGRSVGLIAYGDQEYVVPLGSGTRHMSALLETLAWSKTEGEVPLADVLSASKFRVDRFYSIIVVTASTATDWCTELRDRVEHGPGGAAILIDPSSYGSERSSDEAVLSLIDTVIPVYVVRREDFLPLTLSRHMTLNDQSLFEQPSMTKTTTASKAR